jgi:alkylated DNA nucleotide flippase Atl1
MVNAQGKISQRMDGAVTQRIVLEREGVEFRMDGRMDLKKVGWRPRSPRRPRGSTR